MFRNRGERGGGKRNRRANLLKERKSRGIGVWERSVRHATKERYIILSITKSLKLFPARRRGEKAVPETGKRYTAGGRIPVRGKSKYARRVLGNT